MKDKNLKLELLYQMIRIREVEKKIAKEYHKQQMRCPVHLSIGQEAPSAALNKLVKKSDFSVSTHRGHAHYLAKGGSLKKMIAEIYGKFTGCSKGKGGSMHLIDKDWNFMGTSAIVGNSIPTGTGLGLAAKLNKKDQISIVHIGDGAIEEGVFYESVNFAIVRNLPVFFLCENNSYSVYSPLNVRQPKDRIIYKMVKGFGISFSNIVDGNNVLSCYQSTKEAINYCRRNSTPVFLEYSTYRILEHCGPNNDDHLSYRSQSEIHKWGERDPIKNLIMNLDESEKIVLDDFYKKIWSEIDEAFEFALNSPKPSKKELYKDIYAHK